MTSLGIATPGSLLRSADDLQDLRTRLSIFALEVMAYSGQRADVVDQKLAALQSEIRMTTTVLELKLREAAEKLAVKDNAMKRAIESAERRVASGLNGAVVENIDSAFDPHGFFVYLLLGHGHQVMYVGQSRSVWSRIGQHMRDPVRCHGTQKVSLIRCRSQNHMCVTEDRLIALYQPPWNVVGIRNEIPA